MYEVIDMKQKKQTRILCTSKGTPMQFAQALEARISELGGESVDSATRMKKQPVNAAAGFLAKAIAVMGEAAVSMFLDKLIDKVMEWLSGQGVDGAEVTHDNDNLIINLLNEAINIPLENLHFDPEMIDEALNKVAEFVKETINASTHMNVQYPNGCYDSENNQYINDTVDPIIAGELNYNTPELKNLRRAIQNIVVDSDAEFIQLVNDMVNNAAINYVPETRALKRCIDNMLDYESADAVLEWVFKYATDLGCIESSNINASTEPTVDAEVERYLHTLVGDVQTELSSEVEGVKFSNDNANLYVTVTYMGSEIDYTVPLADLDLLWDNMESDVAYIVNTILQDLDNM